VTDRRTERHADSQPPHNGVAWPLFCIASRDKNELEPRVGLYRGCVCVQLQCLSCGQRCPRVTKETWSTMPWILQLVTGRSTSPQKTASDHRHQQDASDVDECNCITDSSNRLLSSRITNLRYRVGHNLSEECYTELLIL